MAVAITEPVAEINITTNAATYAFPSFTPTAGSVLVIIAGMTGFNPTSLAGSIANTSGTALGWAQIGRSGWATNANGMVAWWAGVPSGPVASVYTIGTGGANATGAAAVMFSISGAAVTSINPIRQVKFNANTASTNATTGTLDLAMRSDSAHLASWFGGLAAASSTPPASWTEIADVAYTTPNANIGAAFRAGTETGTSVTFTNATTNWGICYVEVHEALLGMNEASAGYGYYGYGS